MSGNPGIERDCLAQGEFKAREAANRNARIVAAAQRDPDVSAAELARRFGLSDNHVARLLKAAGLARPKWRRSA